ncbi:MAG: acetolactate synthase small subunit [Candidatus Sifarchaeia archaeon]
MTNGLHVISLKVLDQPGVLQRISSLISRRNFNVHTISAGATETEGITRITITFYGDDRTANQVVRQLDKLQEVKWIEELEMEKTLLREIAVMKVKARTPEERADIMNFVNVYAAKVVEAVKDALAIEVTGGPKKVSSFIDVMETFGITQLVRSGALAIERMGEVKY